MGVATVAGVLLPLLAQALVRWARARGFVTRDRWRLWVPIGGSIAVATAWQVPARRRAAVLGAGLAAVYGLIALGVFGYFHWIGQRSDLTHYLVEAVDPSYPAHAAMRPGDRIVAFEGEPLRSRAPLAKQVDDAGAQPLALGIVRAGREQTVTVTPRLDEATGRHRLGITFELKRPREPMGAAGAVGRALVFPFSHGRVVVRYIWSTLGAEEEEQFDFVGPVGITALKVDPPLPLELSVAVAVCVFVLLVAADFILLLVIGLPRRHRPA